MKKYDPLFEKYRTQDSRYYLPGLDITVKLPRNQSIRNDGFVSSIVEHTRELAREMEQSSSDEHIFGNMGLQRVWLLPSIYGGISIKREFGDGTVQAIIYYQEGQYPVDPQLRTAKNIAFQGHEETHALHLLNQLNPIKQLSKAVIGKLLRLKQTLHPETIADTGEILALLKKGYSPKETLEIIATELPDINNNHASLVEAAILLGLN